MGLGCGTTGGPPRLIERQDAPPPPAARRWRRTPPPAPPITRTVVAPAPVQQARLSNGLRVVVVEQRRRPVVSIRLVFDQGSAHDPAGALGSTFFAVSLLAGYYEVDEDDKRVIEADSFARKVFFGGGQVIVDVGPDQSYFGVDGYAKDASTYLDLLSGAIIKPRCGPRSLIIRRDAMINALEEVELSDEGVFQLFIDRAAFGAGHPYARPAFGTIESLKKLEVHQVRKRQRALLDPRNATLLIAGDVRPSEMLAAARGAFGAWPRQKRRAVPRPVAPPPVRARTRALLIPRSPAASMVVCATRALSDVRGQDAELEVLAQILGASLDSRLGTGLRMEAGVSYGFSASILERRHARALFACTRVREADTARALTIFKAAIDSMVTVPPTHVELMRAQRQLITAEEAAGTTTHGSVARWLHALAIGEDAPTVDRSFERVTAARVHALARRIFTPDTVRFVLGGSTKDARQAVKAVGLGPLRRARLDL